MRSGERAVEGGCRIEAMRILSLDVAPYRDGRRVRMMVRVSPVQEPFNLDIQVLDEQGQAVVSSSVIETRMQEMDLTLHVPDPDAAAQYTVQAALRTREEEAIDEASERFRMMSAEREA